jgi:phospholipase C
LKKYRHANAAPSQFPSRREALLQLGVGVGAVVSGTRCMPAPIQCGGVAKTPGSSARLANIETIVVLMMENRSFDHHLGALRMDSGYASAATVDGLKGSEECPDSEGTMVSSWRLTGREARYVPTHKWDACHDAFHGGRNDGFVQASEGAERNQVMGYHDREHLPVHYALADQYTVCDHWFSSVMGPTWPNRFYLQAGTSDGRRVNHPMGFGGPATLWERMAERCRSTRNYFAAPAPWYAAAFPAKAFSGNDALVAARIEDFFRDAHAGNLPEFAIIDPDFLGGGDGHPAHDLSLSEVFIASVYRAMVESPQWSRSLLIVTYDEHGGYYDHVPPPQTVDPRPEFGQLGFRVPALVIGPTVWQGKVISDPFEHVSVAATLGARYGIESLGPRMDAARDLSSCIDPARLNAPAPPPRSFPVVEVSAAQVTAAAHQPPTQVELAAAIDDHQVPASMVDPRSTAERLDGWLRHAQELEAVRVVR